ncbi:MAG: tetratricopeptide repeat protein [Candidatus Eisenbacteria bacterium]|nr:tetratricopeptide repeat protein [Candidatus Eisenbacteria bacterium]
MRTHSKSRTLAAVLLLVALAATVALAAVPAKPAAPRDSSQVESAPAPFIKPAPVPNAGSTAPDVVPVTPEVSEQDTALASLRRRAREEFGKGLMLEEQSAYSAAIIAYTNAARRDPTLKGPSYRIGLLFMSRQQYEAAARSFREELRRDPDNIDNAMEYALALCELGDTTRSQRMLEDLTRRAPGNADVWRSLGFVHGRQGHYEQAEKALRGAVGLKPKFAKAWRDLGVVLAARGRDREARDAYNRALAIDPRDESSLINLANLESRTDNHAHALELYGQAERIDSTQALAYRGQIRELVAMGREGDAGAVWKRWLAASNGDAVIREGAARHFVRQRRADIAVALARDGVRERPKAGETWWLLAEMQAAADDPRAALDSYRRAWRSFAANDDKARALDGIRALRAAAPDSLRALFEADSLSALSDTTRARK